MNSRATGSKPNDAVVDIHEAPVKGQANSSPFDPTDAPAESATKHEHGADSSGPYKFAPDVGDNWERCLAAAERYDNDMCTSWREEMDTLGE